MTALVRSRVEKVEEARRCATFWARAEFGVVQKGIRIHVCRVLTQDCEVNGSEFRRDSSGDRAGVELHAEEHHRENEGE